jgi:hypothetical protein
MDPEFEALAHFRGTSTVLLIFSAIVNNREGSVHVLDWLIVAGRHAAILAQNKNMLVTEWQRCWIAAIVQ